MKGYLLTLLFFLSGAICLGQSYFDELQTQLQRSEDDTSRILVLGSLAHYYGYIRSDSAFYYARKTIELSQKSNYTKGEALGFIGMSYALTVQANYPKALEMALQSLKISEQLTKGRLAMMAQAYRQVGLFNRIMGDTSKSFSNLHTAIRLQEESGEPIGNISLAFSHLGYLFVKYNIDSALIYSLKGYHLAQLSNIAKPDVCVATAILANTFQASGDYHLAKLYYDTALQQCFAYNNVYIEARVFRDIATLFNKQGNLDSCLYYAHRALRICQQFNFGDYASSAAEILSKLYESQHKSDSALKYLRVMLAAKDSIFSQNKMNQFQLLIFENEQNQKEIDLAKAQYQNKLKLYSLLVIVGVFLLLTAILYRNNRHKQKVNILLQQQKQKVESTLSELKSTQAQLIQSEKMASLGELTAGIAHEIQNPLNFVNNFSEVNKEMIDEATEEINKGNVGEVKNILNDIKDNSEKINHHGKRADAIVKGMLQHSRASTGKKELADINVLVDEYLRLSYHGMRAKDKSFNAEINTDFDNSIGKINVVPQDIGRVLLNLFNNSLYAIGERRKAEGVGYEPFVSVCTKKVDSKVEIRVKDNGSGIPQKVVDKVFQPFFTTKPTGQGTGLGLSLAYDIITKEHNGTIKVESKENEGSEFIITL